MASPSKIDWDARAAALLIDYVPPLHPDVARVAAAEGAPERRRVHLNGGGTTEETNHE